ncbi:MAG: hypothetical protein IJQ90_03290 [Alphaproteobacteria bacterium]|nr:hypothetical protein [Alphaproteobacteria bacterium]
MKKMSLEEMVKKVDESKKVNPLDLSSDQDLSIALMNLVSLEEHFFFSGAKTKQPGFYDLINVVRNMRKELMERVVDKSGKQGNEVWCISKHLLAASMRLYEVGTKALGAGNKKDAYKMFEKAYELYSLFWGLNMKMIDLSGVQEMEPEFYGAVMDKDAKKSKDVKKEMVESRSAVQKLGDWVKKTVNCCIE